MKTQMKKGFTLVEMMIVVAIIAVLAGVAIPQYNKYVKKSETTEALRFMKQIIDAEIIYNSHSGSFLAIDTTDADDTGAEKIGFDAPTEGQFKYYKATACSGTVPGIVVQASTASGLTASTSVYMYYPSNVTLKDGFDSAYYEGTTFIQDYVNEVATASAHVPACP